MPALGAFSNVWNTALHILRQKGYQVWTDETQDTWYAERDGWDYTGNDPIQLLGLVAIYESVAPTCFEPYWWLVNTPGPLEIEAPSTIEPRYKPVWEKPREDETTA